jgi:nucleotide-binding universal stress UspA family protein
MTARRPACSFAPMGRKLIVGYDGSPNSEDALALGSEIAGWLDAELVIATAGSGRTRPKEGIACLAHAEAVAVEGPAGRALVQLAERLAPVAAVVVGSTHRSRLGQVVLGCTGSTLLAAAGCPIAVAPPGHARGRPQPVGRIGVAVGGMPEARAALDVAAALARRLKAHLTVFGVLEPVPYAYDPSGTTDPILSPAARAPARERHMARLLARATSLLPSDLSVERRILAGDPARALAQASADLDLLAIGCRGLGARRSAVVGGVSARLIATAGCPVLALPRRAGRDPLGLEVDDRLTLASP